MPTGGNRRNFLRKLFAFAGSTTLLPAAAHASLSSDVPITVEFKTYFPHAMTLAEYRSSKILFENKDKVATLTTTFKKSKKMLTEKFSFHESHCMWQVTFNSRQSYEDWMSLTEELESHMDIAREQAGFKLEIRTLS